MNRELQGGSGPKNRTREKFENPAKPPRGIQERKLHRKFHQDRRILKYSKLGELNAREKKRCGFSTENSRFQIVTKSVTIRISTRSYRHSTDVGEIFQMS